MNAIIGFCASTIMTCLLSAFAGHAAYGQQASTLTAVQRATVTIETDHSTGSAFFVKANGIAVTAAHVLEKARQDRVILASGQSFPVAGVLHYDPVTDLAIVKVNAINLGYVPLGQSQGIQVGQRIIAIGSPLGFPQTVSDGIISSVRSIEGRTLLQISAPVSPGSSGGPISSEAGEVIGVVVSGIRGGAQRI